MFLFYINLESFSQSSLYKDLKLMGGSCEKSFQAAETEISKKLILRKYAKKIYFMYHHIINKNSQRKKKTDYQIILSDTTACKKKSQE